MPFKNITFPPLKLIHGMRKSVYEDTITIKNGSQNLEDRIKKSRWPQYNWIFQGRALSRSDLATLLTFYNTVEGLHYSFKFQDPDYPALTNGLIGYSTGTEWFLNIPFDVNTVGRHPIFNVDVGSLSVTVDGAAGTITSFNINSDGLPVLNIAGTTGTETVRVTGPFFHTVRFNMMLDWGLGALDINNLPSYVNIGDIQLVERFEY